MVGTRPGSALGLRCQAKRLGGLKGGRTAPVTCGRGGRQCGRVAHRPVAAGGDRLLSGRLAGIIAKPQPISSVRWKARALRRQ